MTATTAEQRDNRMARRRLAGQASRACYESSLGLRSGKSKTMNEKDSHRLRKITSDLDNLGPAERVNRRRVYHRQGCILRMTAAQWDEFGDRLEIARYSGNTARQAAGWAALDVALDSDLTVDEMLTTWYAGADAWTPEEG